MPLDPRAKRLLDMLAMSSPAAALTTQSRRDGFAKLMQMGARPQAVAHVEDIEIKGPECPLKLRLYDPVPDRAEPAPALVFLHGGGLVAGSIETHDAICRDLANALAAPVFSVGYRLAPEWRFPASLVDASFALDWVAREAAALDIDPARIAIGGESAGGMLAALIANGHLSVKSSAKALLLLCPVIDLAGDFPSRSKFATGYLIDKATLAHDIADCLGEDQPASLLPSPLRHGSAARTPPTVIVSAECDPFRDEALLYAQMLEDEAVPVRHMCHAGMVHSFYGLGALLPQARPALEQAASALGEFLRA